MNRRTLLRSGLAPTLLGLAGCGEGSGTASFEEGFEDGIGQWASAAAIGPEVALDDFDWSAAVTDDRAASGQRSLELFTEGDHDDGTAWVVHPVRVPSPGRYQATVTASFWSESESFNTLRNAVMRLGPDRPESEADFPDPGVNTTALGTVPYGGLREPLHLSEGWREYRFEWTTPPLSTDTLYVAAGTSVVWEADATHYLDDLTVDLSSR
ncbi:hypothetical protein ACFQL1_22915 [Halomicroarcula sp. GCM10025709]|uniref:hypothetical protein n=1 Tax=Haloarcula TaxID=2237 RepID=UPI0024C38A64|nr:hypothetical protein [Halomicroarcula sp. YJ-61-S]